MQMIYNLTRVYINTHGKRYYDGMAGEKISSWHSKNCVAKKEGKENLQGNKQAENWTDLEGSAGFFSAGAGGRDEDKRITCAKEQWHKFCHQQPLFDW